MPVNPVLHYFPRGLDAFIDIKVALPDYQIETFFDVGANIGQSAIDYTSMFPSARIFSFEPVEETYRQLLDNTRKNKQVHCFKMALSSYQGEGKILAEGISLANHLIEETEGISGNGETPVEDVNISTLDEFCESKQIENISYLKVDTEGEDLNVLRGSSNMLTGQQIDFVELEAGMHPYNSHHVSFNNLKDYMEQYDYLLFGIYVQTKEFYNKKSHLRRTNPLFISRNLVEA
ncbi:MAG TPA: FkbM family methyltransferase [Balneolaceae bacterium]